MNRIVKLIDRLNALTGEDYEIHNWGRGDWSLYNGDNEVTNTLSAAIMERYIRELIRAAANA